MNFQFSGDVFRSYLFTGERILWTGRPKQGITLSGRDGFLIPFSLLWGGFAIFWNVGVWTFPESGENVDWFFRLWGLPFLVIGIYIMIGRFFHDAAIRKHITYAVTDQRVLILKGSRSQKFSSLDLSRLPRLELTEHRDGTGTIAFDNESSTWFGMSRNNGFDWWVPSLGASSQFFRIDNPRRIYELIRDRSQG